MTGVANQAPETNATGNTPAKKDQSKRMSQQVFHPSMFQKPGSSLNKSANSDSGNQCISNTTSAEISEEEEPFIPACPPPDWQRVPSLRSNKRPRISEFPPNITTQNRFNALSVDDSEIQSTSVKRPISPPPIILYGIENVQKLSETIQSVVDQSKFRYKIMNRNNLRISCEDSDTYKKVIDLIRSKGIIGHTFTKKDERCARFVIKNLHHTTPVEIIKEEIEKTGNKIRGEIFNVKHGPDKKPTPTFFINVEPGPNNKDIKNLKYIYHQVISVEDLKKKKQTVAQCYRCQQYGHTKNNCLRI